LSDFNGYSRGVGSWAAILGGVLRCAIASLVGLLLIPSAASAALPPAHPPGKSVAGVKLGWPADVNVLGGSKVSVTVRSSHRRTQLALLRVDERGTPTRALARRTLRSGTFTATVPNDTAHLMLRATIAGKRYWTWITSIAPVSSPVNPAPMPAFPCHPPPSSGPAAVELRLGATTLSPGGSLPYSVVNTGQRCQTAGAPYAWQLQQPDGSWQTIQLPWAFPMFGIMLPPGASYAKTAQVPADAAPGTYRLLDSVTTDGEIYPAGLIQMVSGPIVVP
jgi:hypothetical protein